MNEHLLILKSNMDRFIADKPKSFGMACLLLKSNMDRFIDEILNTSFAFILGFKIQYG